jgi:type II secretory pathway component GspD/PulD (secretin)
MRFNNDAAGRHVVRPAKMLAAFMLALLLVARGAHAQTATEAARPNDAKSSTEIEQTIFLTNLTQKNDLNDVQTDLRNMLPQARIYCVASQNAISIHGTPDDIQLAQKLVAEFDRPRKIYRLTYTIIDMDSGKRTGAQTFALIAASSERTIFKQGSKVPIVTGSFETGSSAANTQVQYQDVGLAINFTVEGRADGVALQSKVEQSTLAEDKSGVGPQDPVLRQSVLEGSTALTLGKPLVLGSLDIPGTTRKQEISVVSELVK